MVTDDTRQGRKKVSPLPRMVSCGAVATRLCDDDPRRTHLIMRPASNSFNYAIWYEASADINTGFFLLGSVPDQVELDIEIDGPSVTWEWWCLATAGPAPVMVMETLLPEF